jgi:hypothetical protein
MGVLLVAIAMPRPAETYDDSRVKFLSSEPASGSVPRIEMLPFDVNRLPASAFGD